MLNCRVYQLTYTVFHFLQIDPVKIESVEQFASPSELAKRVLAVEQGKEGYIEGEVLSAQKSALSSTATTDSESLPLTVYDLDYKIETTRGLNHFLVRTAVANKRLYVLTTQCKESSYENLSPLMHEIASSLTIP